MGPEGLIKQLTKALIERAMETELSEKLGYSSSLSIHAKTFLFYTIPVYN